VLKQTCRLALSVGLSLCLPVCPEIVAKRIWMSFWVVSEVGRGMGALDRVEIVEGKEQFWEVNVVHPTVHNAEVVT